VGIVRALLATAGCRKSLVSDNRAYLRQYCIAVGSFWPAFGSKQGNRQKQVLFNKPAVLTFLAGAVVLVKNSASTCFEKLILAVECR
jgi:hypothetical protein